MTTGKTKKAWQVSSLTDYLTTGNNYVDVGIVPCINHLGKIFQFTATTNNLVVNVLGSLDNGVTYTVPLEADITVTTATPVRKIYSASATVVHVTHIKIQVKPAVGGSHGTLGTKFLGYAFA